MLDASGEYSQLADYLIKETEKTFRLPDSVNRNLTDTDIMLKKEIM